VIGPFVSWPAPNERCTDVGPGITDIPNRHD
jgi:hypothetical protein